MQTYNRRVKVWLKILSRLEKLRKTSRIKFFWQWYCSSKLKTRWHSIECIPVPHHIEIGAVSLLPTTGYIRLNFPALHHNWFFQLFVNFSHQSHTQDCVVNMVKYSRYVLGHFQNFGSRPSDHYFRSVCWFVCLFVCLFVQSFSQLSLIQFGSN